MTNPQPTGKFTLPIMLSDKWPRPDHQVSYKVAGLVLDLFYDKAGNVTWVELSGTVEQLMKSIRQ